MTGRLRRPVLICLQTTLIAACFSIAPVADAGLMTRDVNVTLSAENIESFDLDVDLDGITDFTFTAAIVSDPLLTVGFDVVDFPFASDNGVVIDAPSVDGFPTVSRLGLGDIVSPGDTFSLASFDQGNLFFFTSFDTPTGNFNGQTGFIGLRFDSPVGLLFGFAEVTVNALNAASNPLNLTIGTVGFNDVPGQAVRIAAVPEPSMLALWLIGGLLATPVFRKRQREPSGSTPSK